MGRSMKRPAGERRCGLFHVALFLLALELAPTCSLEVGRRGGAFLSTTGSFTLSAGTNTAGNDEALANEELGQGLDGAPEIISPASDELGAAAGAWRRRRGSSWRRRRSPYARRSSSSYSRRRSPYRKPKPPIMSAKKLKNTIKKVMSGKDVQIKTPSSRSSDPPKRSQAVVNPGSICPTIKKPEWFKKYEKNCPKTPPGTSAAALDHYFRCKVTPCMSDCGAMFWKATSGGSLFQKPVKVAYMQSRVNGLLKQMTDASKAARIMKLYQHQASEVARLKANKPANSREARMIGSNIRSTLAGQPFIKYSCSMLELGTKAGFVCSGKSDDGKKTVICKGLTHEADFIKQQKGECKQDGCMTQLKRPIIKQISCNGAACKVDKVNSCVSDAGCGDLTRDDKDLILHF